MKKRKFFSFMLMGLLTLGATSMVTSCKDYDDDINNLQDEQAQLTSQINTLQSTLSSVQSAAASHATTEQLNAVQSQVTSQGTQLNSLASQVTSAISSAESASAAAAAAQSAVETLRSQIPDVSGFATKAELANYVTATTLNEKLDSIKEVIQNANAEQLQKVKDEVAKYTSAINNLYTAVTSVSIVGSFDRSDLFQNKDVALSLTTGKIVGLTKDKDGHIVATGITANSAALAKADWSFGVQDPDKEEGYTQTNAQDNSTYYHNATPTQLFKYGNNIEDTRSLLIRVSPTNAAISKENVKLIDSQGNELTDVVVSDVQPYDGTLTRAGSNGGLWEVTLALSPEATLVEHNTANNNDNVYAKHNDPSATSGTYIESTLSSFANGKYAPKLYAVAVNNTLNADTTLAGTDERNVVSSYDVSFAKTGVYKPESSLDAVKVYPKSDSNKSKTLSELKGYGANKNNPNPSTVIGVENGAKFVVEFKGLDKVAYFYVDKDRNYAGEDASDQSEGTAWDQYTFDGIQKIIPVVDGKGKAELSVTMPNAVQGDDIAFRVFAVNYDGTYTVIGGKPFVVHVGAQSSSTTINNAQIKVTSTSTADGSNKSEWYPISGLKDGTISLYTTGDNWKNDLGIQSLKVGKTTVPFKYQTAKTVENGTKTADATKNSEIAYIRFSLATDPYNWTDGSTASGEIIGTAANGLRENTISVSITKVLPTVEDAQKTAGFSWKENQLVNGVYTAYMVDQRTNPWKTVLNDVGDDDGTSANDVITKDFTHAFNLNKGLAADNIELNIDGARKADKAYTTLVAKSTVTSGVTAVNVSVNKDVVKSGNEYPSTLVFNYGKLSSVKDADGNYVDVTRELASFNTKFACPMSANSYEWTTRTVGTGKDAKTYAFNTITYGATTVDNAAQIESGKKLVSYIKVTNTFDNSVFGGTLLDQLKKFVSVKGVTLTSNGTGNSDYFTCGLNMDGTFTMTPTKTDSESNPTADVESTLTITLNDIFGEEHVVTLPFVVKRR